MRRLAPALLALVPLPAPAQEPAIPVFVEETAGSGLAHSFSGGWEFMVGGGVASFDCSGDGLPELFLAGGAEPSGLFLNESIGGALAFRRIGEGIRDVAGAYALDIDADGLADLVLLRVGENLVLRGVGDCRFEPANAAWGFDGGDAWSTAFAATWEDGADWPTLAIGNYIDRRQEAFPWGNCSDNWLHRPAAGGAGFAAPLPLAPGFCALSLLFTDWNRSGRPSLRVSNDREYYKGGQEQLWHLPPGAAPRPYTEAEGWQRLRIWGMGIAGHDLDGDGFPEYFLTSMADNKLQVLAEPGPDPRPRYADVALARGVTAHRPHAGDEIRPSTAWHAQFEDVNNDGLADLFIAKGNVWEMPDFAERDPNNLLLQRPDGSFLEASAEAGVASFAPSRGGAVVDLNGDGLLDIVSVNRNAPAQVWRNAGPAGNWIAVDPEQPGANRNAVNAWVEVRAGGRVQRREVTVGGGHAGGVFGPQHFGLGAAEEAEVRVIWPDGEESGWQRLPANGRVRVLRE